ncbi:MAG: helix-turn-helix transcriptional regulator [Lachnospiraceae bacterium]|nr:helix-turn-helix transcriptional regulator [Lachnospiraceae bacterium]
METEMECPLRYLQNLLGGKWKMPIVCMLAGETPLRNATIKRRLGQITSTMLSQTLRELEADGIVNRKQFNEVPPHVEYSLTERGKSIVPILAELGTWATEQMGAQCKAPFCGECTTKC